MSISLYLIMYTTPQIDELRLRFNLGERLDFVFFWGHQPSSHGIITASCFSQWYDAAFEVEGQRYPTAEHFMMAEKAALFGDKATQSQILQATNPGAAKALGREVKEFDEAVWLQHRFDIVVRGNMEKFKQHQDLQLFLLQTEPRVLVEASPVDSVWGIGLAANHENASNPNHWKGLNLLGFALMEVRRALGAIS